MRGYKSGVAGGEQSNLFCWYVLSILLPQNRDFLARFFSLCLLIKAGRYTGIFSYQWISFSHRLVSSIIELVITTVLDRSKVLHSSAVWWVVALKCL